MSRTPALLALLTLLAPGALAQWATDPSVNLAVADGGSDQAQVKLAPTADGGCWVSWFDGIGTGWDVRVQKLDIGGKEVLPHGGVLVEDRSFSSTQDYGLDVAPDGSALLAYRDDGGVGIQIGAAKVAPDGTLLWNVLVTNTGAFVAAPKICGLSDGGVVVAWTQDSSSQLLWLDGNGVPTGFTASLTPVTGSYSVNDLHDSGTDAILSITHQTGGFGSPRRILTQAYTLAALTIYGNNPIAVMHSGSLQFGNFPAFEPDGDGGGVFSWYDASTSQLQCYVQHILPDGSEGFAPGGVAVSTDATRVRVSPDTAYDAATGDTFVFWTEQNATQSQSGVWGQKLDSSGARQWGAEGVVLEALSADSNTWVRALTNGPGALVCWNNSPSFGTDVLVGALVDGLGGVTLGGIALASTPSSKSRLAAARAASGTAVLAWQDNRTDANDILAQNVNEDGTLGARWTDLGGALTGINGPPHLSGFGPLTAGSLFGITLVDGPPSAFCLLWISVAPSPFGFFGGTVHAFPFVEQLLLATDPAGELAGATGFPVGIPPGTGIWFQFVLQDLSTLPDLSLSNGLKATTP